MSEQRTKRAKWAPRKYAQAAQLLRTVGYDVTYNARKRETFHQRGIVRRLYEEKKSYFNFADFNKRAKTRTPSGRDESRGIEYNFKFQKLTAKERKLAQESGMFSKLQYTKGGVFIEKPANVPAAKFKVKFTDRGVEMSAGKRKDLVVRLDGKKLVADPMKEYKRALGKYKFKYASLMVRGFNAKNVMPLSMKQLFNYLANELLPEWMERNEKYYEDEEEAAEEFADIFHLRLIF